MTIELAVIGGTGLYLLPGLVGVRRIEQETPYGAPSAAIVVGSVAGRSIAFLARHGDAHTLLPHRVNYRANLFALHALGARRVVAINAVGGISTAMRPRALALPNQIIDYTHGRITSYCDAEATEVRHIDLSEPYTESLRQEILEAAAAEAVTMVPDGVYGATQGPRLETVAEIARLARDGCDLVGMTGMPEAALARELDLEFACIALVANWAAGCDERGVGQKLAPISLEEIHENLREATARVPRLITRLLTG